MLQLRKICSSNFYSENLSKFLFLPYRYESNHCTVIPEEGLDTYRNQGLTATEKRTQFLSEITQSKPKDFINPLKAAGKNAAVLKSLNFDEQDILNIMVSKQSLLRTNHTEQLIEAAKKLQTFGFSDVSKLGKRFISSFEYIAQGKSDEILNYLSKKYQGELLYDMFLGRCNPFFWKVEDIQERVGILEDFGVEVSHKYLSQKNGPMGLNSSKMVDRLNHLESLIGKENAKNAVQRNFLVLLNPTETVSAAIKCIQDLLGSEVAAKIVVRLPPVCALTPEKSKKVFDQLSQSFEREDVITFFHRCPSLFYAKPENVSKALIELKALFGEKEAFSFVLRSPRVLTGTPKRRAVVISELSKKFGKDKARAMIKKCSSFLCTDWERNISKTLNYLLNDKGRSEEEVVQNPLVIFASLEKRLKPRFDFLENSGVDHFNVPLKIISSMKQSQFEMHVASKRKILFKN